jgi:hypothetical protein
LPHQVVDGVAAANAVAGGGCAATVTASYVEIYNEQITDLLDGEAASVRGDALQASTSRVESLGDAVELLRCDGARALPPCEHIANARLPDYPPGCRVGEARKSRAATKMNDRSSRAHTVLLLKIKQTDPRADKVGGGGVGFGSAFPAKSCRRKSLSAALQNGP